MKRLFSQPSHTSASSSITFSKCLQCVNCAGSFPCGPQEQSSHTMWGCAPGHFCSQHTQGRTTDRLSFPLPESFKRCSNKGPNPPPTEVHNKTSLKERADPALCFLHSPWGHFLSLSPENTLLLSCPSWCILIWNVTLAMYLWKFHWKVSNWNRQ